MVTADWMQARIAELERANAALVAERDEAVKRRLYRDQEVSEFVGPRMLQMRGERDAAVRELGIEVERRLNYGARLLVALQERDAARAWSAAWKRAAVMYRGAHIYLSTGKYGPHAPEVTYADPDEDELAPFGWTPGLTAGKECRSNAGAGYAAQEREGDHA